MELEESKGVAHTHTHTQPEVPVAAGPLVLGKFTFHTCCWDREGSAARKQLPVGLTRPPCWAKETEAGDGERGEPITSARRPTLITVPSQLNRGSCNSGKWDFLTRKYFTYCVIGSDTPGSVVFFSFFFFAAAAVHRVQFAGSQFKSDYLCHDLKALGITRKACNKGLVVQILPRIKPEYWE